MKWRPKACGKGDDGRRPVNVRATGTNGGRGEIRMVVSRFRGSQGGVSEGATEKVFINVSKKRRATRVNASKR